jgi:alpha-N-arabinofuranosidase
MSLFRNAGKTMILAIAIITVNGFSQSTVTFDVNNAKLVIPNEIYGVLMERLGRQFTASNGSGMFVGTGSTIPNTDGMRNDIIDGFKECGVGAAEWPGGCAANGYTWQNNKRPSNDVGVDRFIKFCTLTGAEAMIAGRPTGADAASNFAFAQYIIDSLKYPLKYFKIGNEVWGCGGNQTVSTYIPNYTTNYNKLKDYFKEKGVKIIAGTDLIGKNDWMSTMVAQIGSQIDGVEIHDYLYFPQEISSVNPTVANYWNIVNRAYKSQILQRTIDLIKILDQKDPAKRVKIIEDEWGEWLIPIDKAEGWMQQNTLMSALSAGEQLHVFMMYAERVEAACLAQGVSVIQSLMNINSSKVMVKTPTFYVFKLYKPHHTNGAKLVPITAQNFENVNGGGTNMQAVTTVASFDKSGIINMSFTNIDLSSTRKVNATITTTATDIKVLSAEVVTGESHSTANEFGQTEKVNIQTLPASAYALDGKTLSVTLPSKSIVMIRLKTNLAIDGANKAATKANNELFTIKTGTDGRIAVISSINPLKPISVRLYSIDGKTLLARTLTSSDGDQHMCTFEKPLSKGTYLIKFSGNNVNMTKRIFVAQ